ncbi:MAG: tRNA 2-thiouridine(34) synthase MnmA, partial [Clostridiales bacterium]|nr:tRNA 2-thiouridine(34) synthase MnmA [Clostridiales bacterium]
MTTAKPGGVRVVIGMSGGVDSSVAAALLKQQGYDVIGVTMKLHNGEQADGGCCSLSAAADALRVADKIGIPHYVMNFTDAFEKHVIAYFIGEYKRGRTPNPCTACNKRVKFDALLEKARALGAEYVATGHYAKITERDGRFLLERAADDKKDQTYFLYNLSQYQLSRTRMPLYGVTKDETREIAASLGLSVAQKKDSQEICFVPDNDYASFIERTAGRAPEGDFIFGGKKVGRHGGIHRYTVGQRKGLGIALGECVYVTKIDPVTNEVFLGAEGSGARRELTASEVTYIP